MDNDSAQLEFRKIPCSPSATGTSASCFAVEGILELKNAWNNRHWDDTIETDNPMEIWREIRHRLASKCDNEKCWITHLLSSKRQEELIPRLFVPIASEKWCKNPREWLDSNDISKVMKQYEEAYPSFAFYGPAPIDFADLGSSSNPVWPELVKFNPRNVMQKGNTCIGIILNTDPHNKPGEHWISLFVDFRDVKRPFIFFSDSNGDPPPWQVKEFIDKCRKNYNDKVGKNKRIIYKRNTVTHQKKNTECGIYCLHMIISLLRNDYTLTGYIQQKKPDVMMERLRDEFFHKQC